MDFLIKEYIETILKSEKILMEKKKNKQGAGFVIVKKFNDGWRVLGLKVDGEYDLPKGRVDKKDKSIFHTAQRECYEECGISVSTSNLEWGNDTCQVGPVTIFLAKTKNEPHIRPNPNNGVYEHESAEWLTWDELMSQIKGYLVPAVFWAKTKVEG